MTFDADNGAVAGPGRADLMRYGWEHPVLLDDHVWDGEAWVRDAASGCAVDGAAARSESAGTWHYELAKPFGGDACDLAFAAGQTVGMRIEFRENRPAPHHGDNFRWPRGSEYIDAGGNRNGQLDEVAGWGDLVLSQDGSSGVPAEGDGTADGAGEASGSGDEAPSGSGDVPGEEGTGDGAGNGSEGASGRGSQETGESPSFSVVVTLATVALLGYRLRRGPLCG